VGGLDELDDSGVQRLIQSAGAVAGAAVGAATGLLVGDPVLGAAAGQTLSEVGKEIARRYLSPRQEQRAGTVLVLAAANIMANEALGNKLRNDGFFDGERSDAEEIAEGILLAAMDEHEERKLPYMANMLGNLGFMPQIDVNTANRALSAAEQLSWLEMRILAIVSRKEELPLPAIDLPNYAPNWADWTTIRAANDLRSESKGMLAYPRREEPSRTGIRIYDLRMSSLKLSSGGQLLSGLMELDSITRPELEPIYQSLLRAAPPDDGEGDADEG